MFGLERKKSAGALSEDATPTTKSELIEMLSGIYPDTAQELIERAARSGDFDKACDVIAEAESGGSLRNIRLEEDPLKELEKIKRLKKVLPEYEDLEVRSILHGFDGDCDKAEKTSLERPELITLMMQNTWTIKEAEEFDDKQQKDKEAAEIEAILLEQAEKRAKEVIPYYDPPHMASKAQWEELKQILLSYAAPGEGGFPACWEPKKGRNTHFIVTLDKGDEYRAVANYFAWTLPYLPRIHTVARLQNPTIFNEFVGDSENLPMFHGCKVEGNEMSIARTGFQVGECKGFSDRFGKGTWFAFKADYSDRGYVARAEHGRSHIFICIVSKVFCLNEDHEKRVVGQGGGYPLWIITYSREGSRGGY